MIDAFTDYHAAAAIPVVVALTQLFKMTMSQRINKFSPFISLGLGLMMSFLLSDNAEIHDVILNGILYGLGASGLYSGVKHTAHAAKQSGSDF